jgi:hypothetical protein
MARATAFEKLRVTRELRSRPLVAAAFGLGRISYCAVRWITRATDTDPEVDEALIAVAEAGTVADVERAVRTYWAYQDQDRPPPERCRRRGIRFRSDPDGGLVEMSAWLQADEAELFRRLLWAMAEDAEDAEQIEQSPRGDSSVGEPTAGSEPEPAWSERLADALMDLADCAHHHHRGSSGPDRTMVHVVVNAHQAHIVGGDPLHPDRASLLVCDCTQVTHYVDMDGTPLAIGRAARQWNTAQRRAIYRRDNGTCRWPGCNRQHVDIHHLQPWEHGGPTDIDNGVLACRRHHRLLHAGWTTAGDANGTLTFKRR